MIFYLTTDGKMVRQDNDLVYQGSDGADKITVITTFLRSAILKIAFTFPSGATDNYQLMYREAAEYRPDEKNPDLVVSAWSYKLPYNVTAETGRVGVSIEASTMTGAGQSYSTTSFTGSFDVEYSVIPRPIPTPQPGDLDKLIALMEEYYLLLLNNKVEFVDLGNQASGVPFDISPEDKGKLFADIPPIVKIVVGNQRYVSYLNRYDLNPDKTTAYYSNNLFLNNRKYFISLVVPLDGQAEMVSKDEPIIPSLAQDGSDKDKVVQANAQGDDYKLTPTKAVNKSYPTKATQIGFDTEVVSNEKKRIPSSYAVLQAIINEATRLINDEAARLDGLIDALDTTKAAHDQVEAIDTRLTGLIANTVRTTQLRSISADMLIPNYVPEAEHVIAQCDNITGVPTENKSGVLELFTITEHEYIQVWRTIEMGEPVTKTRCFDIDMWSAWR